MLIVCVLLRNISDDMRTRAELFQKSCGPMPKRSVLKKAMGCTDNSDNRRLRRVVTSFLTKYLGDFKAFRDYDYAVVLYPLVKLTWQYMNREKLHGRQKWTRETTHHVVHASLGDGRRNERNRPKQDKKRADKRAEAKRRQQDAAQQKPFDRDTAVLHGGDSGKVIQHGTLSLLLYIFLAIFTLTVVPTETTPLPMPAVLPSQVFADQASTPAGTTQNPGAGDMLVCSSPPVQPAGGNSPPCEVFATPSPTEATPIAAMENPAPLNEDTLPHSQDVCLPFLCCKLNANRILYARY
jgi:hypothetical protein